MDGNPCIKFASESDTAIFAALVLYAMIEGRTESAEEWLRKVPRSERGRIKIALDDADMLLSRIGRG